LIFFSHQSSIGSSSIDLVDIKLPTDYVQNVFSKTSELAHSESIIKSCENSQAVLDALERLDSNYQLKFWLLDCSISSLKVKLEINGYLKTSVDTVPINPIGFSQSMIEEAVKAGLHL